MTYTATRGNEELADLSKLLPQIAALSEAAAEFEELLGAEIDPGVGAARPDARWLRAHLRRARIVEPDATTDALVDHYDAIDAQQARRFGVALVRALEPRGALATVPRSDWFSPAELRLVDSLAIPSPVTGSVDLRQRPGKAMDYRGYLCAIMKLTRACNLRCSYCHDWREGRGVTMDLPSLARSVQQVMSSGASYVEFVWHGGEPLLIGARGLVRFLMLQEHFAPQGTVVSNHIQTNGTVLTDRLLRLMRLFGLRASISLDGPPEIHDSQRRDKRGEPTWRRVSETINELRSHGMLSGVLMVVSRTVLALDPVEVWNAIVRTGTPSVSFLAERPSPGYPVPVTSGEFVAFLLRMSELRARSGTGIGIRELDATRRLIEGAPSGFCELVGSCIGHYITIDPDGSVSHCDKYVGADDYVLGNLNRQPLVEILTGTRVETLRLRNRAELEAVRSCRWFGLCQGWCPHERFVDQGYRERGCCGLDGLFEAMAGREHV